MKGPYTADEARDNARKYRTRIFPMPSEKDRENVAQRWERVAAMADRIAALEARVERLKAHVRHAPGCDGLNFPMLASADDKDCTCGASEALKDAQEPKEGT